MANKEEKEIDLIELVIKFIFFIKKRIFIFILITIIGTSFGFFKGFIEKKKYENKLIGSSDIVPNSVIFQIFNTLIEDFQNNNIFFSKTLSLSKDVSNNIIKINLDTVTYGINNSIIIKIQSKDSLSCVQTKTAFINYLQKNTLIKEEYTFYINQKKQLLTEINKKIIELDSLQRFIRVASYNNKNPFTVINSTYSEYINLVEKKQLIEKEIQLSNRIINIYVDSTSPIYINLLLKTLIWFFISLILSFLTASFYELIIKIRKYNLKT